jgi:hypothetical protein
MFLSILIVVHSFIIIISFFFSILIFDVLQGPHGKFWPPALYTLFTNIIQRRSSSTMTYASVVQTICTCLHCCSNNSNQGNSRIFRKLQLRVLLDFLTRLLRTTTLLITFILCICDQLYTNGWTGQHEMCRTYFLFWLFSSIVYGYSIFIHNRNFIPVNWFSNNNRFAIIALRSAILAFQKDLLVRVFYTDRLMSV